MSRIGFSASVKRQAFERSGGICECHLMPHIFKVACGAALTSGNTFYEHIDPDAMSGRRDLDNCAVLTKTCWKYKTARYDLPVIAKSKRVRDRVRGIYKPRTITAWRKMNGQIVYAPRSR